MRFSMEEARRFAIHIQGLDGSWDTGDGHDGAYDVIKRLGYLQIDTISVVARAHEHALWSRHPHGTPQTFDHLLAQDRRIFEYWSPANAYVPMDEYRYYLRQMRSARGSSRSTHFEQEHPGLLDEVLERIRHEGPLGSSDFAAPEGFARGDWWNWKPAKRALEILFNMGTIMVSERKGFQRRYDLAERILPDDIDVTPPTPDEESVYQVHGALRRLGLAPERSLKRLRIPARLIATGLERALASGEVAPIEVEGLVEAHYLRLADWEAWRAEDRPIYHEVRILSPFDPLVIDRRWLRDLFGFDYTVECYVPKPKRKYGYFSLPVLWGSRFVARADCKADRKPKTFIVRNLVAEETLLTGEREPFIADLADELWRYARFTGCEEITVEESTPAALASLLREALTSSPVA